MYKTISVFDINVLRPGTPVEYETKQEKHNAIIVMSDPFFIEVSYYDTFMQDMVRERVVLNDAINKIVTIDILSNTNNTSPDIIATAEVTSVTANPGTNQVVLNWTNPLDADYSYSSVYRDGLLIGTNITGGTFTDSGLGEGMPYTYRITSTDKALNESVGFEISTRTLDSVPPGPVTNLTTSGYTNVSVDLVWVNPVDVDFSHVIILRDGIQIATNVTGTTYHNSGLTTATTYKYEVIAVDHSGNQSGSTSLLVTTL